MKLRLLNMIPPGVIKDNAAFVANVIDKQADLPHGAKGILFVGQLGVTDIAMAAFKFVQSDTKTDATNLGGTPSDVEDSASKASATDDGKFVAIYVPTEKWTQRYGQLQATAGDGSAGTYFSAVGIVDMPGVSGMNATDLNVAYLDIA